jgi:AraC-like DNA-binding protein
MNDDTAKKEKRLLTAHYEVGRVAMLLDMSPRYVKERIKAGELVGYRLGNRVVVEADSIRSFLQNRRMNVAAV